MKNQKTDKSTSRLIPFQKQFFWEEEGIGYGVINAEVAGDVITKVKIWFSDQENESTLFWIPLVQDLFAEQKTGNYMVKAKQSYSIGLAIAVKD